MDSVNNMEQVTQMPPVVLLEFAPDGSVVNGFQQFNGTPEQLEAEGWMRFTDGMYGRQLMMNSHGHEYQGMYGENSMFAPPALHTQTAPAPSAFHTHVAPASAPVAPMYFASQPAPMGEMSMSPGMAIQHQHQEMHPEVSRHQTMHSDITTNQTMHPDVYRYLQYEPKGTRVEMAMATPPNQQYESPYEPPAPPQQLNTFHQHLNNYSLPPVPTQLQLRSNDGSNDFTAAMPPPPPPMASTFGTLAAPQLPPAPEDDHLLLRLKDLAAGTPPKKKAAQSTLAAPPPATEPGIVEPKPFVPPKARGGRKKSQIRQDIAEAVTKHINKPKKVERKKKTPVKGFRTPYARRRASHKFEGEEDFVAKDDSDFDAEAVTDDEYFQPKKRGGKKGGERKQKKKVVVAGPD